MRILLIVSWLFVGLAGVIYHYGPGQEKMELERIDTMMQDARNSVQSENWAEAVEQFDAVLAELPAEKKTEARGLALEKAKAQRKGHQYPKHLKLYFEKPELVKLCLPKHLYQNLQCLLLRPLKLHLS